MLGLSEPVIDPSRCDDRLALSAAQFETDRAGDVRLPPGAVVIYPEAIDAILPDE
jgi:hypothetical protein